MNTGEYVIGVMNHGGTLLLRRYDKRKVDKNAIEFLFEQICTTDYDFGFNYYHLVEGQIGELRILIIAEIDAISQEDGNSIELATQQGDYNHNDPKT
jgi:hypothetical protein